jgi:hypothetical protein
VHSIVAEFPVNCEPVPSHIESNECDQSCGASRLQTLIELAKVLAYSATSVIMAGS